MGNWVFHTFVFFALLASSGVQADSAYHDFMDQQGRTLRARILRYDARSMQVTIETDNKKTATVPATVFDEEGQQYISEWIKAKDFMDESSFRIDASRKSVDDDTESYGSMIQEKDVESHSYEITLDNRSTTLLKNLTLEYCIYYEQDEVVRHQQTTSEGVLCGSLEVAQMGSKSKQVLHTDSVVLYKKTLDADWVYTSDIKNVQKGEVDGIWIRMTMTTDSGKTFTRDYCLPDSLDNKRVWTTTSEYVGMNRASNKKKKK